MSTSQVTPQTPDPTDGFTAEQEQLARNQNEQPDQAQTFKLAQGVPGGPRTTSPNTVPDANDPTGTDNAAPGPSPLGNVAGRRQGYE